MLVHKRVENTNMTDCISIPLQSINSPVKTTLRVWCLYRYLVHDFKFLLVFRL